MAKARHHFDFDEIEEYLRNKTFLNIKFVQIFMKENNHICIEYEIPKTVCDSFVHLLKNSNKC